MTDHDFEKKWNEMIDEQAPQLWDRIEMRLNALEQEGLMGTQEIQVQQETQQPGFFKKLKQFMFGGGSLRTAASLK